MHANTHETIDWGRRQRKRHRAGLEKRRPACSRSHHSSARPWSNQRGQASLICGRVRATLFSRSHWAEPLNFVRPQSRDVKAKSARTCANTCKCITGWWSGCVFRFELAGNSTRKCLMARLPRRDQIDETSVGVYHCINRCVCQAFLCGYDLVVDNNCDHRKSKIQQRL